MQRDFTTKEEVFSSKPSTSYVSRTKTKHFFCLKAWDSEIKAKDNAKDDFSSKHNETLDPCNISIQTPRRCMQTGFHLW